MRLPSIINISLHFTLFLIAENLEKQDLCVVSMTPADVEKIMSAIEDLYYFEFIIGKRSKREGRELQTLEEEVHKGLKYQNVDSRILILMCVVAPLFSLT
jgi:hypothetical protein